MSSILILFYNNDYIEKTSNSVIGLKMDLKRQLNGIFGLLQVGFNKFNHLFEF